MVGYTGGRDKLVSDQSAGMQLARLHIDAAKQREEDEEDSDDSPLAQRRSRTSRLTSGPNERLKKARSTHMDFNPVTRKTLLAPPPATVIQNATESMSCQAASQRLWNKRKTQVESMFAPIEEDDAKTRWKGALGKMKAQGLVKTSLKKITVAERLLGLQRSMRAHLAAESVNRISKFLATHMRESSGSAGLDGSQILSATRAGIHGGPHNQLEDCTDAQVTAFHEQTAEMVSRIRDFPPIKCLEGRGQFFHSSFHFSDRNKPQLETEHDEDDQGEGTEPGSDEDEEYSSPQPCSTDEDTRGLNEAPRWVNGSPSKEEWDCLVDDIIALGQEAQEKGGPAKELWDELCCELASAQLANTPGERFAKSEDVAKSCPVQQMSGYGDNGSARNQAHARRSLVTWAEAPSGSPRASYLGSPKGTGDTSTHISSSIASVNGSPGATSRSSDSATTSILFNRIPDSQPSSHGTSSQMPNTNTSTRNSIRDRPLPQTIDDVDGDGLSPFTLSPSQSLMGKQLSRIGEDSLPMFASTNSRGSINRHDDGANESKDGQMSNFLRNQNDQLPHQVSELRQKAAESPHHTPESRSRSSLVDRAQGLCSMAARMGPSSNSSRLDCDDGASDFSCFSNSDVGSFLRNQNDELRHQVNELRHKAAGPKRVDRR